MKALQSARKQQYTAKVTYKEEIDCILTAMQCYFISCGI